MTGRLVCSKAFFHVVDQIGLISVFGRDDGRDSLPESFVGNTNDNGVLHQRVLFESLFYFLGEDLFSAGVNADRTPTQ